MDELLSTSQVAKRLAVSVSTVSRWAQEGKLRAARLPSGTYRFLATDVDDMLAKLRGEPNKAGAA